MDKISQYFVDKQHCSSHQIFPGVKIHTAAAEKMMLSLVEFEPGAVVEEHSHEHEQVGILISGELEFFIGDQRQVLKPGQMWRIPGGVVHRVIAGKEPAVALDVFSPIREDYL